MAKVKTSELIGEPLNWSVAAALGQAIRIEGGRNKYCVYGKNQQEGTARFKPSSDWSQGGPIIEREGITITHQTTQWAAQTDDDYFAYGPTPLIAAMRCFVVSKLGDEVEVPEELL